MSSLPDKPAAMRKSLHIADLDDALRYSAVSAASEVSAITDLQRGSAVSAECAVRGLRHHEVAPVSDDVWHGPAAEHALALAPYTEADPYAVLLGDLAWASAACGPRPHIMVGRERHPARLWPLLVGATSTGRKGTSDTESLVQLERVARDMTDDGPAYATSGPPRASGLSSGEGLIAHFAEEDADPRLLVVESEWEAALARMTRTGNSLSADLRNAWDDKSLQTLTIASRMVPAGQHHLVVVGHITPPAFRALTTAQDISNGFLNRLCLAEVRRPRLVDPFDVPQLDLAPLRAIVQAAEQANVDGGARAIDAKARRMFTEWREARETQRDGVSERVSDATGRYTGHALRAALLFSILDRAPRILPPHMAAGIAISDHAGKVAEALLGAGSSGLDARLLAQLPHDGSWVGRYDLIRRTGAGHIRSEEADEALGQLLQADLVEERTVASGGRDRQEFRRMAATG